jgi:hypothetical protein
MAYSTDEAKLVAFETHARTTPVAKSATAELVTNLLLGDCKARRQTLDDDRE